MSNDRTPSPLPFLHSMLLCDQSIREARTGKFSLIGLFTQIWVNGFPAVHQQMAIYFCLTDAIGTYNLKLRIRSLTDGTDILPDSPSIRLQVDDRLAVVEHAVEIRNLSFPKPGKYEISLQDEGREIGNRAIWVRKVDNQKGGSDAGAVG